MKRLLLILAILQTIPSWTQKIPIQMLPSGHIIVPANIDGKEGNFILDTGGGINLFFNNFINDLNQDSSYNFLTAHRATGERIDLPLYTNKEIIFATKKFTDTPYTTFDMEINGIDGLLSLQMFSDTDFIIDFDKKKLELLDLSKKKHKNN